MIAFAGVRQCRESVDYDYFRSGAGNVRVAADGIQIGESSFSRSGDYAYGATREIHLDETLGHNTYFGIFEWDIECTIAAQVEVSKRTVSNIEVAEATLL